MERFEPLLGRKVGELAEEWGCTVTDVLLDLSIESGFKAEFKGDCMDIDPTTVGEILQSPYAVPGISDGGAHCHFIVQGAYPTDLLEWAVREEQLISYEQAHYMLSRLPAHMAGFSDRGVLREGGPADVVVYDPGHDPAHAPLGPGRAHLRLAGRRLAVDAEGRGHPRHDGERRDHLRRPGVHRRHPRRAPALREGMTVRPDTVHQILDEIDFEFERRGVPAGFPDLPRIPAARYLDEEFFALEVDALRRCWVCVGTVYDLPWRATTRWSTGGAGPPCSSCGATTT